MADRKSCDLCPKTFSSASNLNAHKQTHSGVNATSHLAKLFIWRPTSWFTLGRNRTSATSAIMLQYTQAIWSDTKETILEKSLERNQTNATSATTLQLSQATWRDTKGPLMGRSLTDAQCASIPSLQLVTWKSTWWGCIQEKSNWSATRAIAFALCMVSCRATWSHTLCRSPLSATDAAKLTSIRGILQHIWEFTWSESQHLHKTRLSSHSIPEFTRPRLALWFLSIKF